MQGCWGCGPAVGRRNVGRGVSEDQVEPACQGLAGGASLRSWLLMSPVCSLRYWDLPGRISSRTRSVHRVSQDQAKPGSQESLAAGAKGFVAPLLCTCSAHAGKNQPAIKFITPVTHQSLLFTLTSNLSGLGPTPFP